MAESKKSNTDKLIINVAIALLIFGAAIIIAFSIGEPFNDWTFQRNPNLFGLYGNFIGGFVGTIFSLVAAILLYLALVEQRKATMKQEEHFRQDQFEATFFNLLKNQNDITNQIRSDFNTLDRDLSPKMITVNGRSFFAYARLELELIFSTIGNLVFCGIYLENDESYRQYLFEELQEIHDTQHPDYTNGIDAEHQEQKFRYLQQKMYANKFYGINNKIWKKTKDVQLKNQMAKIYGIFFQRYHYAIGHYFRHLYHIIKFVDDFKNANQEVSVKKYIDFIQAQMSSYELALLFYNANSFPKMLQYIKDYNFLENLTVEDLIHESHNCIDGINLKSRKNLL